MPVTALVFAWRKAGTTPAEFKSHYESCHVPLVQSITGSHFPKSHTRLYIQRSEVDASTISSDAVENANYPAAVMIGTQADFDYDAFAELVFEDQTHFQTFMGLVGAKEAAEKIKADEEKFLDRGKMKVVMVDDVKAAAPVKTG